ncbi:MAG: MBL fold metallo-hydrolase [Bacilli bacterium]|jgi:L-ascorbate metabolism protein UlaG (beta-lactamase superfamily)|nr:MBL fold metallo-hydrolase [Bacilli bacterium]
MNAKIKWFGQSWFQLIINDKIIYIDPVLKELAVTTDNNIIDYLPKADLILITHDHYDHCDQDTINKLKNDNTIIIGPDACAQKLRNKVTIMNEKESYQWEEIMINTVPAYNLNKPFHPPNTGIGYLITFNDITIYHAGDTDIIPEMKKFNNISIALLPIGGTYTMDIKEAVIATSILNPKIVIPMHYLDAKPEIFKQEIITKTNSKAIILTPNQDYNLNKL